MAKKDDGFAKLAKAMSSKKGEDLTWTKSAEDAVSVAELSQADKERLRKMLKHDKDFTLKEKFMLYLLMGMQPTYEMLADFYGVTDTAIFEGEKRAKAKIKKALMEKGVRSSRDI